MVTIKKPQEISTLQRGGAILADILDQLTALAKPGVTTQTLDALAEKLIRASGGVPSFKGYSGHPDEPPFPSTLCTSVNEELVHTPASGYELKNGDILTLDIGMRYPAVDGLYTDTAITIPIGTVSREAKQLLKVTRQSLLLGIEQIKPGNRLSDISRAIQTYVERHGFSIIRHYVGHGVGYAVHEDPRIPNFVDERYRDMLLEPGMVVAIEPMVSVGDYQVKTLADGWTVVMADGSLSAHFEHSIAVTKTGHCVVTSRETETL